MTPLILSWFSSCVILVSYIRFAYTSMCIGFYRSRSVLPRTSPLKNYTHIPHHQLVAYQSWGSMEAQELLPPLSCSACRLNFMQISCSNHHCLCFRCTKVMLCLEVNIPHMAHFPSVLIFSPFSYSELGWCTGVSLDVPFLAGIEVSLILWPTLKWPLSTAGGRFSEQSDNLWIWP